MVKRSYGPCRYVVPARSLCKSTGAKILLLSSVKNDTQAHQEQYEGTCKIREEYLSALANRLRAEDFEVEYAIRPGFISDATAGRMQNFPFSRIR